MRSFITVLCMVWGVGEAQAAEWPEEYSVGVSSAVSEGPWWHELGDAQLSGAVDRALAGNPDLRAAHALHVQSKAIAMQQGSALFPQASLNARASLAPTESLGFGFG
ncbi:MAG: outer membrane protein TolC, partial [Kiritimatiellia bacterium]